MFTSVDLAQIYASTVNIDSPMWTGPSTNFDIGIIFSFAYSVFNIRFIMYSDSSETAFSTNDGNWKRPTERRQMLHNVTSQQPRTSLARSRSDITISISSDLRITGTRRSHTSDKPSRKDQRHAITHRHVRWRRVTTDKDAFVLIFKIDKG